MRALWRTRDPPERFPAGRASAEMMPARRRSEGATAAATALIALGYLAYGLAGARHGLASDIDSTLIWTRSPALLSGDYLPSRTSGFPLYEALVALVRFAGGGPEAAARVTLAIGLAGLVCLHRLLPLPRQRLVAMGLFVAAPVILTNASAVMEWTPAITLSTAYVLIVFRDRLDPDRPGPPPNPLEPLPLALGLALVLTRIDASLLVAAAALARAIAERDLRYLAHLAGIGGISFAVYAGLWGGLGFLGPFETVTDPPIRRVAKAAVAGFAASWTAGVAAAFLAFAAFARMALAWRWFLGLATGLAVLRLVAMPDEADYLAPGLVALILVAAVHAGRRGARAGLAVALVGLTVSLSIFEKPDPRADGFVLRPRLAASPAWQALARRAERARARDPAVWARLRAETGIPVAPPLTGTELSDPSGREIVIFRNGLYTFLSPRWGIELARFDRVVLCDAYLFQSRGWRQLRAEYPRTVLDGGHDAGLACAELPRPPTRAGLLRSAAGLGLR